MISQISNFDYRFFIIDFHAIKTEMTHLGKQRTKKLIPFWQKHPDIFEKMCQQGSLFPIQEINAGKFTFFINEKSIPNTWENKRTYAKFYFSVSESSNIWIINGAELYQIHYSDFEQHNQTDKFIQTIDEQLIKTGQKILLNSGYYTLNIAVLAHKNEQSSLGFAITFAPTKTISHIHNQRTVFNFNAHD
jgi:hypothetical protein